MGMGIYYHLYFKNKEGTIKLLKEVDELRKEVLKKNKEHFKESFNEVYERFGSRDKFDDTPNEKMIFCYVPLFVLAMISDYEKNVLKKKPCKLFEFVFSDDPCHSNDFPNKAEIKEGLEILKEFFIYATKNIDDQEWTRIWEVKLSDPNKKLFVPDRISHEMSLVPMFELALKYEDSILEMRYNA